MDGRRRRRDQKDHGSQHLSLALSFSELVPPQILKIGGREDRGMDCGPKLAWSGGGAIRRGSGGGTGTNVVLKNRSGGPNFLPKWRVQMLRAREERVTFGE